MILTEYLTNGGRRPQTAERARKSGNWVGKKQKGKKKKARKDSGQDL